MTIGKRIKQCREALGMSQEELAKKLGYTSRSSIAKIETSKNDMPIPKLVAFAKALDVTPGYLLGSNEVEVKHKPLELTDKETNLLLKIRLLQDVTALESYLDFLLSQQK